MSTRIVAIGFLSIALLAACEDLPTGLDEPTPAASAEAADAALAQLDQPADRNGEARRAPLLQRLFRAALQTIAEEQGPDAARAVMAEVNAQQEELKRAAAAAGTPEARRRAMNAIQLVRARVIVRVDGVAVVERVIAFAAEGIAALEARLAGADANGRDTTRIVRVVAQLKAELAKAREELAAGNGAQALIHAIRAAEGVQRITHGSAGNARR